MHKSKAVLDMFISGLKKVFVVQVACAPVHRSFEYRACLRSSYVGNDHRG